MKTYSEYKDSGVEWIGKIPKGWEKSRIKFIGKTLAGGTPSTTEPEYWNGNIPWIPSGLVQNCIIKKEDVIKYITKKGLDESATKLIMPNAVLVALTGATCGNIAILPFESTANQSVVAIKLNNNNDYKYIYYFLLSQKEQILYHKSGGAQGSVCETDIKNLFVVNFDYKQQKAISSFLDKKTSQIDTLVKNKESMINLLTEQRIGIINHAVTKGLKHDVEMKESGIKWIGKYPKHWKFLYLGYLAKDEKYSFVDGPFGSDLKNEEYVDSGIPLIQLNNIGIGYHDLTNLNYITEEKSYSLSKHQIFKGDIVIAKMAEPVARATIVSSKFEKYNIVADCIRLSPNENLIINKFIVNALNSYMRVDAEIASRGTTRLRINLSKLKKLKILLPPLPEQKEIVKFIEKETSLIDSSIQKIQKEIDLLKEYKEALISEAVTGKIKIPEES